MDVPRSGPDGSHHGLWWLYAARHVPVVGAMAGAALGGIGPADLPVLYRHPDRAAARAAPAHRGTAWRAGGAVRVFHPFVRTHPRARHRHAVDSDLSVDRLGEAGHRHRLDVHGGGAVPADPGHHPPALSRIAGGSEPDAE